VGLVARVGERDVEAADGDGGDARGVRTGALRDRIEDAGRVVITAA
jgi:hypothetical protein